MRVLPIIKISGPICMSPADGLRVASQIGDSLERGEPIQLDFSGVETLTSSYLNAAVGSLYGRFTEAVIRDRLTWTGLADVDEALMSDVRENAVHFYSANDDQQRRLIES